MRCCNWPWQSSQCKQNTSLWNHLFSRILISVFFVLMHFQKYLKQNSLIFKIMCTWTHISWINWIFIVILIAGVNRTMNLWKLVSHEVSWFHRVCSDLCSTYFTCCNLCMNYVLKSPFHNSFNIITVITVLMYVQPHFHRYINIDFYWISYLIVFKS